MNQPLIKIGIPTYNNQEGLDRTINYILNQGYQNFKVYVSINSGSSSYLPTDNRVKVVKHIDNMGEERNFNFVYDIAGRSEYFMFMADDDAYSPGYIMECVKFLESNKDYILCAGKVYMVKNGKTLLANAINCSSNDPIKRMLSFFLQINKNGAFYGVFRNDKKMDNLYISVGADWVFTANLSLQGKLRTLHYITMFKDDNGASSSRKKMIVKWKLNKLQNIFFETYAAFNVAKRLPYSVLVFAILNFKFLCNSIRRRLLST